MMVRSGCFSAESVSEGEFLSFGQLVGIVQLKDLTLKIKGFIIN